MYLSGYFCGCQGMGVKFITSTRKIQMLYLIIALFSMICLTLFLHEELLFGTGHIYINPYYWYRIAYLVSLSGLCWGMLIWFSWRKLHILITILNVLVYIAWGGFLFLPAILILFF